MMICSNCVHKKIASIIVTLRHADSSQRFNRLFVRCQQIVREMSADASQMKAVCQEQIYKLPMYGYSSSSEKIRYL